MNDPAIVEAARGVADDKRFSILAADGTRIVQRVPVRIRILPGLSGQEHVRPGLSAYVTVESK